MQGGPKGRLLIEGYGGGGFEVAGARHDGSILILPDRVLPWAVTAATEIDQAALRPLLDATAKLELLLIGSGAQGVALPAELRQVLRDRGLGLDVMATPAACRTFNILMMEHRAAAAALIAIS